MASHTRQPEVLQELFEALGNDPFVIAECLARPILAERLVREQSMLRVVGEPIAEHAVAPFGAPRRGRRPSTANAPTASCNS